MNKEKIIQKTTAIILSIVSLWGAVVSWLNYGFVSQWQGSVSELAEKNVSLMAVFSVTYWPLTVLLVISCAITAYYLFKNNTLPILLNISLIFAYVISVIIIHVLAVSNGFELYAIN